MGLLNDSGYINNSILANDFSTFKGEEIMTEIKDEILHQAWLKAACELFRQNLFDFPDVVATYGFPAPNSSDGFRGACHHPEEKGKDRRPVIIIHPAEWKDPIEVLTVLLHEAIHAKLGKPAKGDDGHGRLSSPAVI